MNNQIRDNNECKKCCKLLLNDCFDKLFDKYIITNEELSLIARRNESLLKTMSLEQIIALRDSLKEIFDYNHDFNEIAMNFFFDSKQMPVPVHEPSPPKSDTPPSTYWGGESRTNGRNNAFTIRILPTICIKYPRKN